MHRVDNSTSVAILPTPSAIGPNPNSYFSPGDPGSGTPATRVNYDWANAIQEELCYVIEQAGLTLDKTVRTQLKTAIDTLNQKNTANYTTSTTAANTYTATLTPALTAYTNGMIVFIKFTNANSGAATINLNSLGAKSITDLSGAALTSGVIAAGMVAVLAYDGTNFQLCNPTVAVSATPVAPTNLIINGGMDFFQRVDPTVTTNSISNNAYCADRWKVLTQTTTIQGGRTTGDRAKNAIRLTQNQAVAQRFGMIQHIENLSSYPYRSRTLFGQLRIKSSSGNIVRAAIVEWTGTADTPTTNIVNSWTNSTFTTGNFFIATTTTIAATASVTPTAATWTDLTISGAISASANNIALFVWTDSAEAQNMTLDITQVGLYLASSQQFWWPEPIAKELAACQRFYNKSYLIDVKPASSSTNATLVTGIGTGSTSYSFHGTYHVKMITSPTLTLYDGAGNSGKFTNATDNTNNHNVNTVTGGTTGFMGWGGSIALSKVQGSNYAADADF